MGFGARLELTGIQDLSDKLGRFPKLQTKAFKKAARACGKIMNTAAKANLAKRRSLYKYRQEAKYPKGELLGRTGSLKASIKTKVGETRFNSRGQTMRKSASGVVKLANGKYRREKIASRKVYVIVGPTHRPTTAYNPFVGRTVPVDPFYYAHLVELGHDWQLPDWRGVKFKRAGRAAAYPFLQPAMDQNRGRLEATAKSVLQSFMTDYFRQDHAQSAKTWAKMKAWKKFTKAFNRGLNRAAKGRRRA
jgi:hypothetical protein